MAKSVQRHPVRKILLVALLVGVVVVIRNAVADKGGFYDPAQADGR